MASQSFAESLERTAEGFSQERRRRASRGNDAFGTAAERSDRHIESMQILEECVILRGSGTGTSEEGGTAPDPRRPASLATSESSQQATEPLPTGPTAPTAPSDSGVARAQGGPARPSMTESRAENVHHIISTATASAPFTHSDLLPLLHIGTPALPASAYHALFVRVCSEDRLPELRRLLSLHTNETANPTRAALNAGFRAACFAGHLLVVRVLLALEGTRRVDVHLDQEAPLKAACEGGRVDVVQELLGLSGSRQLNVHIESERPLRLACERGHLGVLRQLLALDGARSVNVHVTHEAPFVAACSGGHMHIVYELLALEGERSINVHARHNAAFRAACSHGHLSVVQYLLALEGNRQIDVHEDNEAGFRAACRNGHIDVVQCLLALQGERAVDARAEREDALLDSCRRGHLRVVEALMKLDGEQAMRTPIETLKTSSPYVRWRLAELSLQRAFRERSFGDSAAAAVASAVISLQEKPQLAAHATTFWDSPMTPRIDVQYVEALFECITRMVAAAHGSGIAPPILSLPGVVVRLLSDVGNVISSPHDTPDQVAKAWSHAIDGCLRACDIPLVRSGRASAADARRVWRQLQWAHRRRLVCARFALRAAQPRTLAAKPT